MPIRLAAIVVAGALVLAVACGDDGAATPPPTTATVTTVDSTTTTLASNAIVDRVVDGDTLIADIGGVSERVRLIGIDTPESVAEDRPDQCYGAEAGEYLQQLLPEGTPITLILDEEERDRFDRLLAYVVRTSDQLFVNLAMIEQGYADTMFFAPNTFYRERFTDAVRQAEAGGLGLWGACGGPDVPLD